jgi:hypoxanthine-DNA glycosylase
LTKRSFPPVVGERVRVVILGSLPGEMSLAKAEYYGNPLNQFWRLMERVLDAPLARAPYAARLQTLLARGVGLWDVIRSADRSGSLDAAIRNAQANRLLDLAEGLPKLRAVAFNGATAARIGRRLLADAPGLTLLDLPSSSPAHTRPFDEKLGAWMRLREHLFG